MLLIGIIITGVILYIYNFESDNRRKIDSEYEELICYNCGCSVGEDYNYCPNCREKLKEKCVNCGKMIGVNWRQCPYCDHPSSDRRWSNEV